MVSTLKETKEVDYLVIGGGAMGTAFADAILSGDKKATIAIVDRRDRLAGHWNDAYGFAKLHQPAIFYGVNSRQLGDGSDDLSSKAELIEYYDDVLYDFRLSGRVEFFGEHEYLGNNRASSVANPDKVVEFKVKRRLVNATFMGVEVPSTHPPKFDVEEGVPFVPPNELVDECGQWDRYYVLGCGKTGMDAVHYLLANQVPADRIHWVMSNDVWCFDRTYTQVGSVMDQVLNHCDAIQKAKTPQDVFLDIEKRGGIIRVDPDIMPTKWKCPTVSPEEMASMRSIDNCIREGRIQRISQQGIEFSGNTIAYPEKSLFVNCTADGLARRKAVPVFSEGRIELQSIFFCQQVFSAAVIAALELSRGSDAGRNKIRALPHPEHDSDWPELLSNTLDNAIRLQFYIPLWLRRSRLFYLSHHTTPSYITYLIKALLIATPLRKAARRLKGES